MNLVLPGAMSVAGRSSIISTAHNSQNITHMMSTEENIAMVDAIALGKVTGYAPLDFSEAEQQVAAYQPVLCSMLE